MTSKENMKLPPIAHIDDKTNAKPDDPQRSLEGSTSGSTSSKRFKSFKQAVNIVGKNLKWTKDVNEEVQEDQMKKIANGEKRLTFNVSAFSAHVRSVGTLSAAMKNALVKSPSDRTPKDLVLVQNLIMRIKAFETYSLALKAELSRVLLYQKFGKGRIVIQQGVKSVIEIHFTFTDAVRNLF